MTSRSASPKHVAELISRAAADGPHPLYLLTGDQVVTEPAALRLARALAEARGEEPQVVRRPPSLDPVLQDLRTFSLFSASKIVVVIESSVLATSETVPDLVDEALAQLPLSDPGAELGQQQRRAASCLLQALHLFQIEPYHGTVAEVLERLPDAALAGGKGHRRKRRRRRSGAQIEKARAALAELLEAARRAELRGWAESAEASLAEIVQDGLPEGHVLVLAESACSESHPVVQALAARGAFAALGRVEADRRSGWSGLATVRAELERETGAAIAPAAMSELARRTLKQQAGRGASAAAAAESTARLAAEYRKLASLSGGGRISQEMVEENVDDRGEEDVWTILDAVGAGNAGAALSGIERYTQAAADGLAARLTLFAIFAAFCRQLAAVTGVVRATGVPAAERSYPRFKAKIAPRLQEDLGPGRKSPLAGLHPFRLHRVYLAASALDPRIAGGLPHRVLEAERRLKGDSGAPDAALAELVVRVATEIRATSSSPEPRS